MIISRFESKKRFWWRRAHNFYKRMKPFKFYSGTALAISRKKYCNDCFTLFVRNNLSPVAALVWVRRTAGVLLKFWFLSCKNAVYIRFFRSTSDNLRYVTFMSYVLSTYTSFVKMVEQLRPSNSLLMLCLFEANYRESKHIV